MKLTTPQREILIGMRTALKTKEVIRWYGLCWAYGQAARGAFVNIVKHPTPPLWFQELYLATTGSPWAEFTLSGYLMALATPNTAQGAEQRIRILNAMLAGEKLTNELL
jgi:hypothetical protein